ncbi:glycosyltransferase 18 [Tasmannia lanceolata]|uniref:glycosyltransferase 18 n=1 Tax=Tasmannia lanceolata TaxID=3420 RepID=UPI0040633428
MLPRSDPQSPEQFLKKPKSPDYPDRKNLLYSLQIYISAHPRTWLVLTILVLQLLLVFMARSLPVSVIHFRSPPKENQITEDNAVCDSGRVFVYNLPEMFNKELSDSCESLNPWNSRCAALSNDGFGRKAVGLAGIVPENLVPAWYWTDQFAAEIIYHNRMLRHRCRTLDPDSATAFYIPFYGGLAVGKYLWSNYSSKDRDFHCELLMRWLHGQRFWKRSNGWDHFMMLGRITWDFRRSKDGDWGGSLLYMPGMKNVTRLLIERNPWDELDVGVPYPTGFHPRSDADVREWQDYVMNRNRTTLFCFAGATRASFKDDFRGVLLDQCGKESGVCESVDCSGTRCSNSSSATLELFMNSEFCLQPRGDSFTRRSIFDCMVAGSIPVFFWRRTAYFQYQWFLPEEPESYSVFIHRNDVKNGTSIREVLEGLGEERVRKMRETIVDYIPRFLYAAPKEGLENTRDAFDVALDGVLRRFQEQEEERI